MYIILSSDLNNDNNSTTTTDLLSICYVPDEVLYITSLFSSSQQSHEEGTMIIPIL